MLKEDVAGYRPCLLMFNPQTSPYYDVYLRSFENRAAISLG